MRKQGRLIEHAQRHGFPLVLLCDADGGRMPDVSGWRFSGLPLDFTTFLKPPPGVPPMPRAAAVLGPSYGDSALHASTAHFVVMMRSASLALSGPSVVEPAIGEKITDDELGGPAAATEAGNAHLVVESEADAMDAIAAFLSYLPQNSCRRPGPVGAAAAARRDRSGRDRPARRPVRLRHARRVRRRRRRGVSVLPVGRRLGRSACCVPWPGSTAARSGSSATSRSCGPARWTRRHWPRSARSSTCATRSACRSCSCTTCPG